jgi:Protein of unknown function (DUF551)
MMEWISVKDRLPDYGQQVLFVNGKNQVYVGTRFILEEWATCKYWMPLPDSPKE